MRPHADGMTGATRGMREMRRPPRNLLTLAVRSGYELNSYPFCLHSAANLYGLRLFLLWCYYSRVIQYSGAKGELVPFMVDLSTASRSPSPFRGGNVKATFLLYIHKTRNQRASPERGGARRAEGSTMKSAIFSFCITCE